VNKRIINGEARAFLVVFACAGLLLGLYTLLGRGILESDGGDLSSFSGWLLLPVSVAAIVTAVGALVAISGGRVGGWWIVSSWCSSVAWFGLAYLVT
jgi:hypothetical protein